MLKHIRGIFEGSRYSAIISRGLVGLISSQSINFFLTLWGIKLCVQVFGDSYGIWLAGFALLSLAGLLELGIGPFLVRELTKLRIADADSTQRATLIWSVFAVYWGLSAVIFCVSYMLSPVVFNFICSNTQNREEFIFAFRVAGFYTAIMQPLGIWKSLIHSDQKLATLGLINIVEISGYVLSLTVLLQFYKFLVVIPSCLIVGSLVSAVTSFILLSEKSKKEFSRIALPDLAILRRLGKYCVSMIALKTCFFIKERTDEPIAAKFLSGEMVLIYTVTQKLVRSIPMMLIANMAALSFTSISELIARGKKDDLKKVVLQTMKWLLIVACISGAVIWSINPAFISIWVGIDHYGGDLLSFVFALWIFTEVFTKGFGIILHAADKQSAVAAAQFIEAGLNLILSIFLVRHYGLLGIACGTLIACTISSVYLSWQTFTKLLDVTWEDLIQVFSVKIALSLVPMAILIILSRFLLNSFPKILQLSVPVGLSGVLVLLLLQQEYKLKKSMTL